MRGLPPARVRLPAERDFSSRLRSPAVTARVSVWLGVCFAVAFLTGVYSHAAQSPDPWFPLPTRPAWGYRVTQGLHVLAGTAAVPLLLVKLWTVFPKLFARVPWRSLRPLILHLLERGSIAVLVAAAIFQLVTGLANSTQWYPWEFGFRLTHFAIAWVAIGSMLVHIAVKLPIIRQALSTDVEDGSQDRPGTAATSAGLSRRGLLRTTWLASGVAVLASAGGSVPLLRRVSVFGVTSGDGPQGVPINRTARQAGVTDTATDPDFTLALVNGSRQVELNRGDLTAMRQTEADLPIACVEGWSAGARWGGVPIRELMALVDAPGGADLHVVSLQQSGAFSETILQANFAADPLTLLALRLHGEDLSIDHGFPCRLIAPNRPGVLQTKWVSRIEVLT